jgi:fluoroacetyl-CoA thioesterase
MTTVRIATGKSADLIRSVTDADTAEALGSGDLPVLATPRLLAWFEAATCGAVADQLPPEQTTVGSRVNIVHRRPSPIGSELRIRASVANVDGRFVRFEVVAAHSDGTVVGHGEVTRVVVDRERFLKQLG